MISSFTIYRNSKTKEESIFAFYNFVQLMYKLRCFSFLASLINYDSGETLLNIINNVLRSN